MTKKSTKLHFESPGEVLVKSGGFDLLEGESAAESLLLVVLDGGTSVKGK